MNTNEIFNEIERIRDNTTSVRSNWEIFLDLYTNHLNFGMEDFSTMESIQTRELILRQVDINVISSVVDTLVSRISSRKIKPTVLTVEGSYSLQRMAKSLELLLEGVFDEAKFSVHSQVALRDACLFGVGYLYPHVQFDRLRLEAVPPHEIFIDFSRYSSQDEPSFSARRKTISYKKLEQLFPEKGMEIKELPPIANSSSSYVIKSDLVEVYECWNLDTNFHVIVAGNKSNHLILFEEDNYDRGFPFVVCRVKSRPGGFDGIGVAEELFSIQKEISRVINTIRINQELFSSPPVYVQAGSIDKEKLSNIPGRIIEVKGGSIPQVPVQPSVSNDVYNYLEGLIAKAYQLYGISQLSASSLKPAGITAGIAIRNLQDVEAMRFIPLEQSWENLSIEVAEKLIQLASSVQNFTSKGKKGSKFFNKVKFSDIDIGTDDYCIRVYPSSALPISPAGKLSTVQELMQAGLISREEGKSLLAFPDIDNFWDIENAVVDDIRYTIENLQGGNYIEPSKYSNLLLGIRLVNSAYLRAKTEQAPDEIIELFLRWLDEASALVQQEAPPAPENPPAENFPAAQ